MYDEIQMYVLVVVIRFCFNHCAGMCLKSDYSHGIQRGQRTPKADSIAITAVHVCIIVLEPMMNLAKAVHFHIKSVKCYFGFELIKLDVFTITIV